jgi:hypothetical protein
MALKEKTQLRSEAKSRRKKTESNENENMKENGRNNENQCEMRINESNLNGISENKTLRI